MKTTWPNILTGSRLVIFAGFVYLVHMGNMVWATVAFGLAWGLDAVDGWLARSLHQESRMGYLLDKVVDRTVLFGGVLVLLVYAVVPVYAVLVGVKDVVVGLGLILNGKGMVGDLGKMGKWMTVLQGLAILWLMVGWPLRWAVVLVVAVLGLVWGVKYMVGLKHG